MTKTLLVVHHTPPAPPPAVPASTVTGPASAAVLPDMLGADGYLFGTTANFGYMSGYRAFKHRGSQCDAC